MCDTRYNERFDKIINHPNYTFSMENVHKFIDHDPRLLATDSGKF